MEEAGEYRYLKGEEDVDYWERMALYAETPEQVEAADWRIRRAKFLQGLVGDE